MSTNYDNVLRKTQSIINSVDKKPHSRYIRYLLTKRYPLFGIKNELSRLALSCPYAQNLTYYYLGVIDPMIKECGVGAIYSNYKNKLLKLRDVNKSHDNIKDILSYNLHLAEDPDMQKKFCKFVKKLGVDQLWLREIYNFHGSTDRMPTDEYGKRFFSVSSPKKNAEKILIHDKRHLIDKFILENVSEKRIAKYFRETLKEKISDYDVYLYRHSFFNIETSVIEEKMRAIEIEKKSLESVLHDVNLTEEYKKLSISDRALIKKQSQLRISELEDSMRMLKSTYSDLSYKAALNDKLNFEDMFIDIVKKSYDRFKNLDAYKDRDVVEPLLKTSKILQAAFEKVSEIKNNASISGNDSNTQSTIMELYQKRSDAIAKEQIDRSNEALKSSGNSALDRAIDPDDIEGIEEFGFEMDSKKD